MRPREQQPIDEKAPGVTEGAGFYIEHYAIISVHLFPVC